MDRLQEVSREFLRWYAENGSGLDFRSASLAWHSCHGFIEKKYLEDFDKMHHLYLKISSSSGVPVAE